MLKINNLVTHKKETFRPIKPGHCSIYVREMPIYGYCHIGHARVMIVFDTIVRYLRHSGYKVNYVRSINKNLTEKFTTALQEDEQALSILPSDSKKLVLDLDKRFDIYGDVKSEYEEIDFFNVHIQSATITKENKSINKVLDAFFTVRELLDFYRPEVIRLYILFRNYNSVMEFNEHYLESAKRSMNRIVDALDDVKPVWVDDFYLHEFNKIMDNDFNTHKAISMVLDLASELKRVKNIHAGIAGNLAFNIRRILLILGINVDSYVSAEKQKPMLSEYIKSLIVQRQQAIQGNNDGLADSIKDELETLGYCVLDKKIEEKK